MKIDLKKLNDIDLSILSKYIVEDEFRNYFLDVPGREHYKLLAYLSTTVSNSILLDIGTYKGCSSLALSYNSTNYVKSFDVGNYLRLTTNQFPNIEYIVGNILDDHHSKLLSSSIIILLDTYHDGTFEKMFYDRLVNINWRGILIVDDIKLNDEMKHFWGEISEEKHDVSIHGHHSGTGIVIFK